MAFSRRMALGLGGSAAAAAAISYFFTRHSGGGSVRKFEKGTLHRGNAAEPGSLDPALISGDGEDNIVSDLLTGLMVNGPDAEPLPGMATSWTTAPDGLSWTFKLREAQWSDGKPVTAGDFVFAWQRLLDPATGGPYAYFLYLFKNAKPINAGKMPLAALGVRAVDDRTLEIDLEHPAPYLLEMLTHMTLFPQPRHVVTAKGKDWSKPGNHVGNGAYVLKEWTPNEHITLEKNPRFYAAANVAIQRVIYYPTDDYSAALQRMRAGELDIQDRMPAQQIDWIRQNMPETISSTPMLTTEYVVLNHKRKPFDDIRVRTAVSMATNREVICQKIRRTGDLPAYGIVPPGIANFPGGNVLPFKTLPYEQRLEQAKALMQAAGFGPDKRLKTTYMIRATTAGYARAIAAALQQMYALIYIDAAIVPNDFAVAMAAAQAHDFDICEVAWGADFNDAETFLNLFITGGGDNWGDYRNPQFDTLLAESQNDANLESRGQKLKAAEALLLQDQAIIPLYFWVTPGMAWPYVKGWIPNSSNHHRSRWLSIDEKARAAQFSK